jgi:hypothetical protein
LFPDEKLLISDLRYGFRWDWISEEEAWEVKEHNPDFDFSSHKPTPMSPTQRREFMRFLEDGLILGYVKPVRGTFVNRIFGIDEGRKWRWILDFTKLNIFQQRIQMSMLTPSELGQRIGRGVWCVVGDYQTFYWQFLMHWVEQLRQGFAISQTDVDYYLEHGPKDFLRSVGMSCNGVFPSHFIQPVAGMGVRQAQQKCCRYPRLLQRKARSLGVNVEGYSDEWIASDPVRSVAYLVGGIICIADHGFGLAYSWHKHNRIPTQSPTFIGYEWWTPSLRLRPRWPRIQSMQDQAVTIQELERDGKGITLRRQMSMIGTVVGLRLGVRQAGFKVRPTMKEMGANIRRLTRDGTTNYDGEVKITSTWLELCRWILDWTDHELWRHMRLEGPTETLTSDASTYGWCGHTADQTWVRRALFDPLEQTLDHNIQEGIGYNRTLQQYVEEHGLRGTTSLPICVAQETDNKTVKKCNRALTCRSITLCQHRGQLQDWMDFRGIQSWPVYIPKDIMDNHRLADGGSRRASHWHRWKMKETSFRKVATSYFLNVTQAVDLFCEPASAQTERMVTECWHPRSLWTDALSRPWSATTNPALAAEDWLWIFPPPALLSVVTRRLVEAAPHLQPLLLIVHNSPTTGWWKTVQPLLSGPPRVIGQLKELVEPPEGWKNKGRSRLPPNWTLVALPILQAKG